MRRIAMTGGAGHIASQLRTFLCPDVEHLRLIDLKAPESLASNESFFEADLSDADALRRALEGMDGIIHLGGIPREGEIDDVLRVNVLGTYNLYEAARANGVGRMVFASSNHATGFYPRSQTISPLDIPRPDSRYGLSKCWGELMAGLYYDTAGIRTLSIRIGNAGVYPNSERSAAIWISARDLWQLVKIGLTHPDIAAAVVYGMSRTDANWWRDELAERLGYRPEDNARDHLRIERANESEVAAFFQGGGFCEPDHDGQIRLRDRDGLVVPSGAPS
ncbi:uronate dehydrogenase [Rhizobium petrolearium]|uniref:NAD-dependent epimerase/dehydratase family protein n=1 Tax=Neorhizobium petrolearium TaxID=515361 RepID=UPI001AE3216D|nr:NAD(P)-dependent oxidoreductase [Neorhizobium petrolearium]MBP1843225.1 uronate dehydrogenase [Neorhizobium petrolearium]